MGGPPENARARVPGDILRHGQGGHLASSATEAGPRLRASSLRQRGEVRRYRGARKAVLGEHGSHAVRVGSCAKGHRPGARRGRRGVGRGRRVGGGRSGRRVHEHPVLRVPGDRWAGTPHGGRQCERDTHRKREVQGPEHFWDQGREGRSQEHERGKGDPRTCHFRHQPGHLKRDCPKAWVANGVEFDSGEGMLGGIPQQGQEAQG